MRILVASGSREERAFLRAALERLGYPREATPLASTGIEAIEALRVPHAIDLVVSDWELPGAKGFALLAGLRELTGGRDVSVLFCAGHRERTNAETPEWKGVIDFLERPLTEATFVEKIRWMEGEIETRRIQELARKSERPAPSDLPFFLRIPAGALQEFLRQAVQGTYEAGRTFIAAGEKVDFLHVVTGGSCEVAGRVLGTGDCLGETAFLAERPQHAEVRVRTRLHVSSLSRPKLADLIRRHPTMERLLAELLDPAEAPPQSMSNSEFRSPQGAVTFLEVVQVLQRSRESGTLLVRGQAERGGLTMRAGEVSHAWVGNVEGEEAFHQMVDWSAPTVSFTSGPVSSTQTIGRTTMGLLMQAVERLEASGCP